MWEQIRANRRRSAVLITAMATVLALLGYSVGELIVGAGGGIFGVALALAIWAVLMVVYLTSAESILLQNTLARELKRDDSPRLFNIVDEMKLASGLEFTPKLYLIDASMPNAFAVGRKPETSAIAVTTGLMYRLDRDELQGVIAHEISHLKNRDAQFLTLAAVMLGTTVILSEIARRSLWFGGRGRSRRNEQGGGQAQAILALVALVVAILGPLMAQLLYFACSRKREFLADACAAQFTRYPEGLASALEKISQSPVGLEFASQATAPLFIVNPIYASGTEPDSVFSSHPPTSERIRILRSMNGASLANYEEAYRRAKGGSLIGGQSLQSAPAETIRAPSNEGPIAERHDSRQITSRSFGYLNVRCDCGLSMSVPERYPGDEIRCIRCGKLLPLPSVQERDKMDAAATTATVERHVAAVANAPPLLYTRRTQGWESFRCACGRTVQISPAFAAPFIRCNNCGREIKIQ
jgi:heat shock protein HtpX